MVAHGLGVAALVSLLLSSGGQGYCTLENGRGGVNTKCVCVCVEERVAHACAVADAAWGRESGQKEPRAKMAAVYFMFERHTIPFICDEH